MPNRGGVSSKMHKALQKLQKSMSSANVNYQSIHHSDAASLSKMGGGGSLRNGCVFGRSWGSDHGSGSEIDDDDGCAPYDVPEGYLVVYVGEAHRRFVIKAKHLTHPIFRALLNKSAEEFGYEHKGGLEVACEVDFFEHLLWLIESNNPSLSSMEFEQLVDCYSSDYS